MSAGDIVIRGWFGGVAPYKEIRAPVVSYEPVVDDLGVLFRKKLTRTIICASKDVKTVLQALSVSNATITAVVISSAGASDTLSYGSGWNLLHVGSTPKGNALTELRLEYEKESVSAFEFNLPTGLTLTEENGKAIWKYNSHTIETWDSGRGATTSGVTVKEIPRTVLEPWVAWGTYYDFVAVYYPAFITGFSVFVDNVKIFDFTVESSQFQSSYGERLSTTGTGAIAVSDYEAINKYIRWDTSTSNHIKMVYWDKVVRDWDVTGLVAP